MADKSSMVIPNVAHWLNRSVCDLLCDFHADLASLQACLERSIETKTKSKIRDVLAAPAEEAFSTYDQPILTVTTELELASNGVSTSGHVSGAVLLPPMSPWLRPILALPANLRNISGV